MSAGRDDAARFSELILQELALPQGQPQDGGIGTYAEKRMHRIIKRFVLDDPSCHEISVGGRFIADVLSEGNIWEIQTGSFFPLQKKISYYVSRTDYHVTVVHPVPCRKYLVWIDPETGEAGRRRASPKKPGIESALPELVYISDMLSSGRVSLRLLLIEEEEYRFLDGYGKDRKKHSSRYERLPAALLDDITVDFPSGAGVWLPGDLPSPFTAAEFGKALKLKGRDVYKGIIVLEKAGLVTKAGKRGRAQEWNKA